MRRLGIVAAVLLAACARPPAKQPVVVPPLQEPSQIQLGIALPLREVEAAIERDVPKRIARLDGFEMDPDGRFGIQYVVERDPVRTSMNGGQLRSVVRFRYGVRACTRSPSAGGGSRMWPCVSCGFDEPLREAVAVLDSRLQWDPGLFVRSSTTPSAIEFQDRCRVSLLRLDITDRVRPSIEAQVRDAAKELDARVRQTTSIRKDLAELWAVLQQPVEVAPRTWFVVAPQEITLGTFGGDGDTARTSLGMTVTPRVVMGAKPPASLRPLPHPTIGVAAGPSLRVTFRIEMPFAEAEPMLARQLRRDVRLERAPDGRLLLIAAEGLFAGRPVLENGVIAIPDLEYRAAGFFRRIGAAVRQAAMRDQLRSRARWDLRPMLTQFRNGLQKALADERIAARIASVDATAIHVLEDRFLIDAVATGAAELVVRP
jgi:hypothetical protein